MTVDDMILMGLTQSPKDGSQVCHFSLHWTWLMIQVIIVTCVHLGPGDFGKKQCQLFYDVGKWYVTDHANNV